MTVNCSKITREAKTVDVCFYEQSVSNNLFCLKTITIEDIWDVKEYSIQFGSLNIFSCTIKHLSARQNMV